MQRKEAVEAVLFLSGQTLSTLLAQSCQPVYLALSHCHSTACLRARSDQTHWTCSRMHSTCTSASSAAPALHDDAPLPPSPGSAGGSALFPAPGAPAGQTTEAQAGQRRKNWERQGKKKTTMMINWKVLHCWHVDEGWIAI